MTFDANGAIAIIAILVSAVFSAITYRSAIRFGATTVVSDWLRDLRAWASETIGAMAEATYACRKDDPTPTADEAACILECRHRLSALVDCGRFLLPNERENEYGLHKPYAYRGYRHPALDAVVAAEQVLGGDLPLLSFPDRKRALIGLRREFVSAIYTIVDPKSLNRQIAAMLRIATYERGKDPTLGKPLQDDSKIPAGALGILEIASRRFEVADVP